MRRNADHSIGRNIGVSHAVACAPHIKRENQNRQFFSVGCGHCVLRDFCHLHVHGVVVHVQNNRCLTMHIEALGTEDNVVSMMLVRCLHKTAVGCKAHVVGQR